MDVFSTEQVTSITTAITNGTGNVVTTFVALLPAVVVVTAAIFGINFVMNQFKELKRKKLGK